MELRSGKNTAVHALTNQHKPLESDAKLELQGDDGIQPVELFAADAKLETQVDSVEQNFQTMEIEGEGNASDTVLQDSDPNVYAQLAAALLREVAYKAKEAASQAKAQNDKDDKETFDAKLAETKETFDAQLAKEKETFGAQLAKEKETFGAQLAKEKETFGAQLAKANEETAAMKVEFDSLAAVVDSKSESRHQILFNEVWKSQKKIGIIKFGTGNYPSCKEVNATSKHVNNFNQPDVMQRIQADLAGFDYTSCSWPEFHRLDGYGAGTETVLVQPFMEELCRKVYPERTTGMIIEGKGAIQGTKIMPDIQVILDNVVVGIVELKSIKEKIATMMNGDSSDAKMDGLGQLADYMVTQFEKQEHRRSIAGLLTNMRTCAILILTWDETRSHREWVCYFQEGKLEAHGSAGEYEQSEQIFFRFMNYLQEYRPAIRNGTGGGGGVNGTGGDSDGGRRKDPDGGSREGGKDSDNDTNATVPGGTAAGETTSIGLNNTTTALVRDPSLFVDVRVNLKDLLGEGRESKVYPCEGKHSNSVMKIFNETGEEVSEKLMREAAFMKKLSKYSHMSHYEHIYGLPALAIRISPRGNVIKGMSRDQLNLGQFYRLAKDVMAMHEEQQIVNWDIKPQNIILHEGELVLIDWSHAMNIGDALFSESGYGTWGYHNPARFDDDWSIRLCLPHDDFYALFVVVSSIFPDKSAVFKATMELITSESNEDLTLSDHLKESVLSALTDDTMTNQ